MPLPLHLKRFEKDGQKPERANIEGEDRPVWRSRNHHRRPTSQFLDRHPPSLPDRLMAGLYRRAALVFIAFNAVFAFFYWIGDQPISKRAGGAYIDYLYFSIETLRPPVTAICIGYPLRAFYRNGGVVHGIFSMSLMTGLIFARFSRRMPGCCSQDIR